MPQRQTHLLCMELILSFSQSHYLIGVEASKAERLPFQYFSESDSSLATGQQSTQFSKALKENPQIE
jgi:hypothetical protein